MILYCTIEDAEFSIRRYIYIYNEKYQLYDLNYDKYDQKYTYRPLLYRCWFSWTHSHFFHSLLKRCLPCALLCHVPVTYSISFWITDEMSLPVPKLQHQSRFYALVIQTLGDEWLVDTLISIVADGDSFVLSLMFCRARWQYLFCTLLSKHLSVLDILLNQCNWARQCNR